MGGVTVALIIQMVSVFFCCTVCRICPKYWDRCAITNRVDQNQYMLSLQSPCCFREDFSIDKLLGRYRSSIFSNDSASNSQQPLKLNFLLSLQASGERSSGHKTVMAATPMYGSPTPTPNFNPNFKAEWKQKRNKEVFVEIARIIFGEMHNITNSYKLNKQQKLVAQNASIPSYLCFR